MSARLWQIGKDAGRGDDGPRAEGRSTETGPVRRLRRRRANSCKANTRLSDAGSADRIGSAGAD